MTAFRKTNARRLTVLALLAAASPAFSQYGLPDERQGFAGGGRTHVIDRCVVGLATERELAATEAGILTYVGVKLGSRFQAEEVLAEIDTRESELAYKRALAEYRLTVMRAEDEIEIVYAQKQADKEKADLDGVLAANAGGVTAVVEAEVRVERLEWERAVLGGEKAVKDQLMAGLEVNVKKAEMDLAEMAIEKRRVRAKFAGEVLKLNREEGEWVQPGETIAIVARLDTLQVDGWVYFDEYDPRDIENCRVTIDVPVGPGHSEQATGYVVYVDPIAEFRGEKDRPTYRIRAEISNRLEDGRWVISPNLMATMRIHLGTSGGDAVGKNPRPADRVR